MGHHRWRGRCIAPIQWDWDTMDVQVRRQVVLPNVSKRTLCSVPETNLTPEFFPSFPRELDWGNTSEGAEHLSLCVLDRFLPPAPGEQVDIGGVWHACSQAAWTLHLPFLLDHIRRLRYWEDTLPGQVVRQWITDNQPHYNIMPVCTALTREAP